VALRDDRFLDDMTLAELSRELCVEVCAVPPRAEALAAAVIRDPSDPSDPSDDP
jgi:hypothetical protein